MPESSKGSHWRSHQSLDMPEQMIFVEWFLENCVRTQFASCVQIGKLRSTSSARHGDDLQVRLPHPQLSNYLDTIHDGHHDVGYDQIKTLGGELLQGSVAIGRRRHAVPVSPQDCGGAVTDPRGIVHS